MLCCAVCCVRQGEDREHKAGDEGSSGGDDSARDMFDRKSLKKKALSKERDEIRKREMEARRVAMAAKIQTDLEKVCVCVCVLCALRACWIVV